MNSQYDVTIDCDIKDGWWSVLVPLVLVGLIRLSQTGSRSSPSGSKSAVIEHVTRSNNTHQIDWDNVKALEKEPKDFPRKVLEAIHIWKKGPNLNRDKGLDPVWDNLINPKKPGGQELIINHLWRHSKLWRPTGCSLANSENYIRAYKTGWGRGWYRENVSGKQNTKVVLRSEPIYFNPFTDFNNL